MVTTTSSVIDKYESVWKDLVAYADGVTALGDNQSAITYQLQIAEGNPGAKELKELALKVLGKGANEIIGATLSYAKKMPTRNWRPKWTIHPRTSSRAKLRKS